MSYGILGNTGKDWYCNQSDWVLYLNLAIAFGWEPEGAFFTCAPQAGFGPYPSGSYTCNDWQIVTDDDARAMAVALSRAVAAINAGSPMTDNQVMVLKEFEIDDGEPLWKTFLTEEQRLGLLELQALYLAEHPAEVRTIHTRSGPFDVNIRHIMDLTDVAGAGSFTIT